ncbi:MAG: sugar phosphate isomerase/epimerase [Rikenellaceae bacterium]|nr:sugar phosphate isomerase/epimerase [Rikenellaceae bacterium]
MTTLSGCLAAVMVSAQALPPLSIGVCTSPDNWEAAHNGGCVFIECTVPAVLMPDKGDAEFAASLAGLRARGTKVAAFNIFIPGTIKTTGPAADPDAALAWAETSFRRAQELGATVVVLGSGGSRSLVEGFAYDEAWRQFRSLLEKMGPLAGKYGVTVALEHLNPTRSGSNFITSLDEAARMVREVDDPNIRLLCDTFHMMMVGEPASDILEAGDLIVHCHVAGNDTRRAPGVKGNDEELAPYFAALREIGYSGMISMECSWENFSAEVAVGAKKLNAEFPAK